MMSRVALISVPNLVFKCQCQTMLSLALIDIAFLGPFITRIDTKMVLIVEFIPQSLSLQQQQSHFVAPIGIVSRSSPINGKMA